MKVVLGHRTSQQVAFVGPFGVGKTTALKAVSDIPVVNMDEISAETRLLNNPDKTTTTVGFDYGEWAFADGMRVGLVGVPGQDRFAAMWDTILPRSSAVVLWLFGDRASAVTDCRTWLDILAARDALDHLVVALTRLPDDVPDAQLQPLREVISRYHGFAPLITADPRDTGSVMQAVMIAVGTPAASEALS